MNAPALQHDLTTEANSGPTMVALFARWSAAYEQAEQEFARLDQAETAAAELHPPRPPANHPGYDLWDRQAKAIDSSFGVPGLEECAVRTSRTAEGLAKAILSMTAQTPLEVAIKYRLMLTIHGDGGQQIDDGAPFYAFLQEMQPVLEKYQALADMASAMADIDDLQARYARARNPANA